MGRGEALAGVKRQYWGSFQRFTKCQIGVSLHAVHRLFKSVSKPQRPRGIVGAPLHGKQPVLFRKPR